MKIDFYKYHGTGNDFIMIDNRNGGFPKNNTATIERLCDRRFGIGGDGLILLENDKIADFRMVYYNSDGNESSMCGNGGRCIAAFAKHLGIIDNEMRFDAIDGIHTATINSSGQITLQMKDVNSFEIRPQYVFLDTGSPHHVEFVEDIRKINIKKEGAKIRYGELYGKMGSNVNFVEQKDNDTFSIRTYERGVEDETLSCGTGAVASAIAAHALGKSNSNTIHVDVEGGKLEIRFTANDGKYTNVYLTGPAEYVFQGSLDMKKWQL